MAYRITDSHIRERVALIRDLAQELGLSDFPMAQRHMQDNEYPISNLRVTHGPSGWRVSVESTNGGEYEIHGWTTPRETKAFLDGLVHMLAGVKQFRQMH
jgi:hypothetical protein